NYWKYFIGQTKGLKRMRVADQRAAEEAKFQAWADGDATRKAKYGSALPGLKKSYEEMSKYALNRIYMNEAITRGPEILSQAGSLIPLSTVLANKESKPEDISALTDKSKAKADDFYSEFNASTDQKLFAALLKMYHQDVPKEQHAPVFKEIESKYKGDFDKYAAEVYKNSFFASKEKFLSFLNSPSSKKLEKDPAFHAIKSIMDYYAATSRMAISNITNSQNQFNRSYVAGLREMNPDKKYAPDANSTMRLSYGVVKDYYPMDGVYYDQFTTAKGILEKQDNTNEEFIVDPKLEKLIKNKDFGPYGENGELKVCFISTTDITGGNSGSPVINGNGELVGLAFDGNWEAMSGDIAYDPEYKRTISVDIRYVLFVIDKFAGAGHLVKEMKLVQ
ncbi:MAG TPA: S46 family peptidase, partial [Bacteroidia bacterium]|nr:S46 family peptidase [Bacteroidia bacterium]